MHHKGGVEEKRRLVVVWHDATDEVGVGRVEGLNIKSVQQNFKKTSLCTEKEVLILL